MMNILKKISLLALAIGTISNASAMRYMGNNSNNNGGGGMSTHDDHGVAALNTRAAACAPAQGRQDLQWNNVKARIETGGSMWQDRATSRAAYEVPKGGGVSAIYSGALWMGGVSPDQQLKLAAVTFRADGNDFWPGPLTNDGTAEVSEAVCTAYDKFFISERQDAQLHRAYFDCVLAGGDDCIDYSIPSYFYDYPALGDVSLGQDLYLAPFYDYDGSGFYEPENGDYPWYDFLKEIDCKTRTRESVVPLFGDQTYYWIFNDKGNVHTESNGQPIGMEVRAQAFAFTTNDEINNMTFYNYVLINQGSQTLTETYFGSWVDSDLGYSADDYVGCDVQRGLGYCYNGDGNDEAGQGSNGYGLNPPAVGVDFFEGPYQDADGIDNPLTSDFQEAVSQNGIPYSGLGIGYGDETIDNERFGMRRFVYYNIGSNPINGDPDNAPDYYNYMRGIWKNGATMKYGGTGVTGNGGGVTDIDAGYMFPGDTDPIHWGTGGVAMDPWSEETSGNAAGDRRFIQSAGPFTLAPGDYNNITVGVVWARSFSGDPLASVALLKDADDKAQALFDNCFELVSGPDSPDVTVRELENELILMLSNTSEISNNYNETYLEFDASIPENIESLGLSFTPEERYNTFEGYMVYQLLNQDINADELNDITKARLIFQCDVENGVTTIVNYEFDSEIGLPIPTAKVIGSDAGLERSIRITEDEFATGAKTLVNHKTYYYMAIAYGYNNYLEYNPITRAGQARAFISSRKSPFGEIPVIAAIPHKVDPESNGTIQTSNYGDGVAITRLEGRGAGLNNVVVSAASERDILENGTTDELTYVPGAGPVEIKVVDPLRVQDADFELRLTGPEDVTENDPDSLRWQITNLTTGETIPHYRTFKMKSEDVLIDYGISISWGAYELPIASEEFPGSYIPELISSSIEFQNPNYRWLSGISDQEGQTELNWIRSGSDLVLADNPLEQNLYADYDFNTSGSNLPSADPNQDFETVIGGTWAPYALVSFSQEDDGVFYVNAAPANGIVSLANFNATTPIVNSIFNTGTLKPLARMERLNSVDVVFTPDKSKWTRCAVLEMQSNPELAQGYSGEDYSKSKLRKAPSVDKNGKKVGDEGYNDAEGTLNGTQPTGMGWFPGYAIDVTTGERLNMAFGEDSWLTNDNGRDMIWNPTGNLFSEAGAPVFGGQHWVYVFRNLRYEENSTNENFMPRYDEGQHMYSVLSNPSMSNTNWKRLFASCGWVGSALHNENFPMKSIEDGLIPYETRVSIRVSTRYERYSNSTAVLTNPESNGAVNGWRNLYTFSTKGLNPVFNSTATLDSNLDNINVVPNPYYAFSTYETSKLDNNIKITNVPETCTITIYDMNGTLVRQFKKSDPLTSLNWDLKNAKNIPIGSGTYIIHVDVPGVGEKILKWFGIMRPVDLDRF
ncbi:MAG: T9SS type A sorting domain-containing protein [Flavobacteriales bacterium]